MGQGNRKELSQVDQDAELHVSCCSKVFPIKSPNPGGRGRGGGFKEYREAIASGNVLEIHRRRQNLRENFWCESSSLPQFWLFRVRLMGIQYSTQFLNSEGVFCESFSTNRFSLKQPIFTGVLLASIKEAQAFLAEAGDPRTLDASMLRSEADISPEIQLRIIANKIKKDEADGTSKKRKDSKDSASQDTNPTLTFQLRKEYLGNECNVVEGSCEFAQVKVVLYYSQIFCICVRFYLTFYGDLVFRFAFCVNVPGFCQDLPREDM